MARILVVDDTATIRRLIGQILERGGHTVIGYASDGAEAVMEYQQLRPDAVILDINMPGTDGFVALKQITAFDPDAKVIMCSAEPSEPARRNAIERGAVAYVDKPRVVSQLLEAVAEVLQ